MRRAGQTAQGGLANGLHERCENRDDEEDRDEQVGVPGNVLFNEHGVYRPFIDLDDGHPLSV